MFIHLFYLPASALGVNVKTDIEGLKTEVPHIVVGTPGRILDLATKRNVLDLSKVCLLFLLTIFTCFSERMAFVDKNLQLFLFRLRIASVSQVNDLFTSVIFNNILTLFFSFSLSITLH